MKKIAAYAKLLRLPGIGALGTTTLIGALTVGVYDLLDLFIVFLVGSFSAVFGFLLNDYADVELDNLVDDLKKKPLVSGDVSKRSALMIGMVLMLLTFFLISILYYGKPIDMYKLIAISCIILAGILGSVYDLFGKKIVGSDFLVSISMAFVFLFGALSFGQPTIITWIIFILTFNLAIHMNAVEGGIKDAHERPPPVTAGAARAGRSTRTRRGRHGPQAAGDALAIGGSGCSAPPVPGAPARAGSRTQGSGSAGPGRRPRAAPDRISASRDRHAQPAVRPRNRRQYRSAPAAAGRHRNHGPDGGHRHPRLRDRHRPPAGAGLGAQAVAAGVTGRRGRDAGRARAGTVGPPDPAQLQRQEL